MIKAMKLLAALVILMLWAGLWAAEAMSLMQNQDFSNWLKYKDTTKNLVLPDNSCQIYTMYSALNATQVGFKAYFAALNVDGHIGHAVDATTLRDKYLLWEPQTGKQIKKTDLQPGVKITIMDPTKLTLEGNLVRHTAVIIDGKLIDNATIATLNVSDLSDWIMY